MTMNDTEKEIGKAIMGDKAFVCSLVMTLIAVLTFGLKTIFAGSLAAVSAPWIIACGIVLAGAFFVCVGAGFSSRSKGDAASARRRFACSVGLLFVSIISVVAALTLAHVRAALIGG